MYYVYMYIYIYIYHAISYHIVYSIPCTLCRTDMQYYVVNNTLYETARYVDPQKMSGAGSCIAVIWLEIHYMDCLEDQI